MDATVSSLEMQIRSAKENAEKDLKFYRKHLEKASQALSDKSNKAT
jgi:hypothetical protein